MILKKNILEIKMAKIKIEGKATLTYLGGGQENVEFENLDRVDDVIRFMCKDKLLIIPWSSLKKVEIFEDGKQKSTD